MGFAALSPSYKWLFLSFSGHPEDKSLMLKAFLVWGQRPEQQHNSGRTAKYQRHVPAFRPFNNEVIVLYLFSYSPKSRAGAAQERSGSGDACVVAFARAEEGGDDTVQRAQFLLGALGALKQVAQIAGHAGALVGVAQKAAQNERLLEMIEEAQQLG